MIKLKSVVGKFYHSAAFTLLISSYLIAIIGGLGWSWWEKVGSEKALVASVGESQNVASELRSIAEQYEVLKADDQVVKNASLSAEIDNIEKTYSDGSTLFEQRAELVGLVTKPSDLAKIDLELAKFLKLLSGKDWIGAKEQMGKTVKLLETTTIAYTPKVSTPAITEATANNALPGSGYSRQKVATSRGEFVVSMVVAAGARVVIETAGDSDCGDNCPTKSLAEHVAASGGFAGINGAYFCPPDYPRCQGKVNSFDTLAVNGRTKSALNRANNVYSVVPLVVSNGTSLNFYDRTVDWGINMGGGGAIANYPRLLRDGAVATGDEGGRGMRGFIGTKDGSIVIGHIYSATLGEAGEVLKTLGLSNALNLDGGGSSALWADGGYKVGPGRSLPTAIVLVR